jgi:hypothetical protein
MLCKRDEAIFQRFSSLAVRAEMAYDMLCKSEQQPRAIAEDAG